MHVAFVRSCSESQAAILAALEERGHDVHCFDDAREALKTIRSDLAIDMLITGALTAPISGLEVCWEARLVAGEDRPLYILFVVPAGEYATKIEALDSGADETLDELARSEEFHAKLRVAHRITSLQRDLIQEASTDYLSGADNRRAFFRKLTAACSDADRGGSLSIICLDVDRFKAINDRYGHDVGDEALRTIAAAARKLRLPVGRLGGDEFGVILRDCNLDRALKVASALQREIFNARLQTPEGIVGVTCSLGVSEFRVGDAADDLMKRADLALYQAKAGGGDNVATTPKKSWMNGRPSLGVSLVRLLPRPSPAISDRRKRQPASDALIARICAVIDLLIASGLDEDVAFEAMSQRLIVADIPLPNDCGARSSWPDYLREQREVLCNGTPTEGVLTEYKSVVAALNAMAPHERVRWALENEVWDRRRTRTSFPSSVWIPARLPELVSSDGNSRKQIVSSAQRGERIAS